MENESTTPTPNASSSSKTPVIIIAAIVVIILIGVIAYAMSSQKKDAMTPQPATPTKTVEGAMEVQPTTAEAMSKYKDGKYEAVGNYTSPGGAETLDVTITLKDGVVEDANVVSKAFRPTSKQMQASFISGYKDQVIGKKIDEIHLTKVSASSLAPKGFNDAVEKIKTQATS